MSRTLPIRKRLFDALPTDADLNAFCQDYFPHVFQRFSSGMDRLQKVTLLLEIVKPEEIGRRLDEHASAQLTDTNRIAPEESKINSGEQPFVNPDRAIENSVPGELASAEAPTESRQPRGRLHIVWAAASAVFALIASVSILKPPQVNDWLREKPSNFFQAEVLQDGQEVWAQLPGILLHSTDSARTFSQEASNACGFWLVRDENQPRLRLCSDGSLVTYYTSGPEDYMQLLPGFIRSLALSPDGVTAWAVRDGISRKGSTPVEIHKTTNRGENWSAISSQVDWKLWDHLITARRDGRRLFGYPPVLPGDSVPGRAILASDDDGRDWHPVLQAEGLAINRIASSSFTVCAVGRQIYRSKDGGDTWQQVPGVPPATLWDVQSVNDGDYWATGDNGVLLRSSDCQGWMLVPTGSHASFRKVRVAEGGKKIFLFGDNKILRVSTDGGTTWQDPLSKGPPSWYYPVVSVCLILALIGAYLCVRKRASHLMTTASESLATLE